MTRNNVDNVNTKKKEWFTAKGKLRVQKQVNGSFQGVNVGLIRIHFETYSCNLVGENEQLFKLLLCNLKTKLPRK